MKILRRLFACICIILLILASSAGCKKDSIGTDSRSTAVYSEDTELGTGEKTVTVDVVSENGTVTFTIHTDKETLGDALTEHKLISGEQGAYGMYVKVVNGITADYEVNQSYWSFSKDGKPMQTGVDSTSISDGEHYEITLTKQ